MVKALLVAAILAAGPALAQSGQAAQNPPQQQPQQPQQPAQPHSQSTAGSQGESSSAQPSSPGASSQQVVVNPPPAEQPRVQPQPPPSSTTVVNPPATYPGYAQGEVVVRREERNPMMTVAIDAAYGGLAGLLVGTGVALVNEWDNWGRDMTVGAGVGVLVGAAVGAAQAAYDARREHRRAALDGTRRAGEATARVADGMNRTDKDPVITRPPVFALAFRF